MFSGSSSLEALVVNRGCSEVWRDNCGWGRMVIKHFRISGVVQGVGFRASTRARAMNIGLSGWVKNCANGDVEVLAKGGVAQLDVFEQWLYEGPRFARVDHINASELSEKTPSSHLLATPITQGFSIIY